jgi:hypothetical protein
LLAPFLVIWSFNCHALHCTLALDPFLAKNVESHDLDAALARMLP